MDKEMERALLVQLDRIAAALEAQVAFINEATDAHGHSTPEEEAAALALRERELIAKEESNVQWREHNRLHLGKIPHAAPGQDPYH